MRTDEPIRNLMSPLRVHHAVVVFRHDLDVNIYGRVWDFVGVPVDGIHPMIVVRTPGGSMIQSGRMWVRPANDVEMGSLYGYEFAAREIGRVPYETEAEKQRREQLQ